MDDVKFNIKDIKIQLLFGNCLSRMKELPDGSIDLIATDLPYGVSQNRWDTVIPFDPLWFEFERILKNDGAAIFTASQPFTSRLVLSNLDWFKYDIIWQKTINSGQLNVSKRPLRSHEEILVFYNKFGTYNEQKTKGAPYSIKRKANNFVGGYGKQCDHEKINEGVRNAKSVIKIANPRIKNGHKTQKPVKLMEYIIRTYSNEDDVVLDCCMGVGTTGEACINLNRHFVGIELIEEWFKKSMDRLKGIQIKLF